jgi:hypothetical protein
VSQSEAEKIIAEEKRRLDEFAKKVKFKILWCNSGAFLTENH